MVKRFLEKSRNLIANIIMMLIVFDWCIKHVQCTQNGAIIVHCVVHKRAIILCTAGIIYTCMKRLFMGWKRLFTAWKDYLLVEKDYLRVGNLDYLQLWPSFCRIVSLFLITWHKPINGQEYMNAVYNECYIQLKWLIKKFCLNTLTLNFKFSFKDCIIWNCKSTSRSPWPWPVLTFN